MIHTLSNDFLNKSNMSDLSKEINELAAKYASGAFVGIVVALCPEAAVAVASAYGGSMLVGNNYSDSISSFAMKKEKLPRYENDTLEDAWGGIS